MAVKNATVLDIFTSKTYGNCIKYITDDGYEITYAHLEKAIVQKDEKIKMGQKIGIVGNTGLSTGIHLHYIIEKNGELINPIFYVNYPYSEKIKKALEI